MHLSYGRKLKATKKPKTMGIWSNERKTSTHGTAAEARRPIHFNKPRERKTRARSQKPHTRAACGLVETSSARSALSSTGGGALDASRIASYTQQSLYERSQFSDNDSRKVERKQEIDPITKEHRDPRTQR